MYASLYLKVAPLIGELRDCRLNAKPFIDFDRLQ